jgi:glycosyltransferase involved in cell wall biosynthesis
MKKHCWLLRTYEPLPGIDGESRPFRYDSLARELLKKNLIVTLWTSDFHHSKKAFRHDNQKTTITDGNYKIIFLPAVAYKKNISFARIKHNRLLAKNFTRYAEKEVTKPDIIVSCVPTLELAEAGVNFGIEYDIPVVTDFEDIWPDVYLMGLPSLFKNKLNFILFFENLRLKRILSKSRAWVTISNSYLNWVKEKATLPNSKDSNVFPLGYPTNELNSPNFSESRINEIMSKFQMDRENFIVLFIGQLEKSYDIETVISAAENFLKNKKIKFIIGGDGAKRHKVVEASEKLNNLIYTGWLNENEILSLLKISKIGLIPYKKYAFQSLPYKPFEYMCGGLALLSSLEGDLAKIIDKNKIGLNYTAGNKDSLIQKIEYFFNNEKITKEMGVRSRQLFLEKYRSELVYSEFSNYISKMIS